MHKKGILLINIGTPESYRPIAVFRYLKQFLNDPRVIDLPGIIRWWFINGIILPLRYKKSAKAYQKIWLKEGSPLLVYSMQLREALSYELSKEYQVELGMRYGKPSIESAYHKLKDANTLTIFPLFPQYTSAATGSAIASVLSLLNKEWNIPEIRIKKNFYDTPGFIAAYREVIKKALSEETELLLFSYHGLPERHIRKSKCQLSCNKFEDCPTITEKNDDCYRAQCFQTSRLLAEALSLKPNQYRTSFQSRLGRTPWIKPYTDKILPELIGEGIRNIAVVCPSFVTDCLETLEEVQLRIKEQWLKLGGKGFTMIPCLNTHPMWIKALRDMICSLSRE